MLTRLHSERIAAASYVPTAGYDLTHMTNDELIAGTRRLVGASNQILAMLLAHLAEVEARGIHRARACSSLYTYCIYELRFSEDAAYRRVSAARLIKRFPALYEAIASGELHLTGLLMLGPHLTPKNLLDVLGRAKHGTKKELGKLLRALDPLPDLPARIEPLAPAPARPVTARPSWADFVESLSPVVRELEPGDAPRAWMNDELPVAGAEQQASLAAHDKTRAARQSNDDELPALARPEAVAVTGPLRYGVQFSAEEEYVQLVERAKALLSLAHSKSTLEEIHLRAMRLLRRALLLTGAVVGYAHAFSGRRASAAVRLAVAAANRLVDLGAHGRLLAARAAGVGGPTIGFVGAIQACATIARSAARAAQAAFGRAVGRRAGAFGDDRDAGLRGHASVAVGLVVAAAHFVDELRAHVGNLGAGSGHIGRPAVRFGGVRAILLFGAAYARDATAHLLVHVAHATDLGDAAVGAAAGGASRAGAPGAGLRVGAGAPSQ